MRRTVAVLAAFGNVLVRCHRSLLTKASCDSDFGSSATALAVPDPSISWAFKHYFDCTHRAVWMSFVSPSADFKFYVGVGTPPMPRHSGIRADAVIVGPGLPQLSSQEWQSLPAQIRNDSVWDDETLGAILHQSPTDQSTCSHLGAVMQQESAVVNGRCDFYEPFGKTNSWRILDADENVIPHQGGTYYVAVWMQEDTSGKLGIALGTWVEDFVSPFEIAAPSCTRSILDWSEKMGDQENCFPVVTCSESTSIPNSVCTAQGSCGGGGGSCEDTLATNPMCTFGGMCDCATVTQTNPCGTVMSSAMGSIDINSVCGRTCGACGSTPYEPQMGCGGTGCPSAVELWDGVNANMHAGMAINFTGTVAVDFVRSMIPHHSGAVDMCNVLVNNLSCHEDGALSGLVHFCNHIKMEQEREIAGMRQWLADNSFSEAAACSSAAMASMGCHTPASDTISSNPLCTFGQQCDCNMLISSSPCGTTIESSMGSVAVNDICGGTCGVCNDDQHSEGMSMGCGDLSSPSSEHFLEANHKMMAGMSIEYSCDPAVDFVRGMAPHHAGAIAMCDVLTEFSSGSDPYLAALCNNITVVQRAEIAFLSEWLLARGHAISTSCERCDHPVQPEPPCDDKLPASSFCHVLGGDFNCRCEAATIHHSCGAVVEIPGFGHLNVSAECMRTCGHCPAERPPLFHFPCGEGMGGHMGGHTDGHSNGDGHGHDHGDDNALGVSGALRASLGTALIGAVALALLGRVTGCIAF